MTPEIWYALAILLALAIVRGFKLDVDPGPAPGDKYPRWDRWSAYHLIGSVVLALGAVLLGVNPWWALVLTILAGVGWEIITGYFSTWDCVWDVIGAVVGTLLGLVA